jgi:signal transduction histidine kinase
VTAEEGSMKFSAFIEANLDAILDEWDAFARTLLPAARTMTDLQLRDHAREILLAIAEDMKTSRSEEQRSAKSRQITGGPGAITAGASHGSARHVSGFDLPQLVGEFRALRASVLSLWSRSSVATAVQPALEEIARFNEAVDQALAESVERYSADVARSRDIFLAVLGHDVRGPLSGIRMATDVLVMPTLAETMRMQVAMRIRRASETIARLTSDLLEYTRSRLGRGIPIERSACDLLVLCEEALDTVKGTYPEQQFVLRFSGDLGLELDPARMQQVLLNLLHNAVQHGDRSLPVALHVEGEEDAVVMKVANFGAPIATEVMQVIFEPLITVPLPGAAAHERSRTSLGLGLFIVREIVQGHHGTISVSSAADTGTVFTVRLPRLPS